MRRTSAARVGGGQFLVRSHARQLGPERRLDDRVRRDVRERSSRADFWPHHHVATDGSFNSSPSRCRHRPGRNAMNAGLWSRPLPGSIGNRHVAGARRPRPGRARRESSRCAVPADRKTRRPRGAKSRPRASRPASVLRKTRSSRTVKSWPSTSCSRGSARDTPARNRFRCTVPA